CVCCSFFFFFQAEDGIRDKLVTGVQTCALPIFFLLLVQAMRHLRTIRLGGRPLGLALSWAIFYLLATDVGFSIARHVCDQLEWRSEERRVGKECRSVWATVELNETRG